jgi:hypothetical protein
MCANQYPSLVNYLATLQGKAKERLWPLVPNIHQLLHRVTRQKIFRTTWTLSMRPTQIAFILQ